MNRILLFSIALLLSLTIGAQRPYPTLADVEKFSKSTTCVVMEDDAFSFFNAEIKAEIQKYWTVTPYKFITTDEFYKMWKDPSYSFIVLTQSNFSNDKSGSSYDILNLLLGAGVDNLDKLPEFCTIPLSFTGDEEDDYTYKLGLIIRFLQQHAETLINNPTNLSLKYLKYYNKNVPEIKNKTILIRQQDIDPAVDTEEKIKVYYPYALKIVDEEAIVKAVEEKTPGTLIFHKVGPPVGKKTGTCLKMLIGTDDAVMYYYDTHLVDSKNPNGLLISDLKRIGRF
jgi:hypothetical protein